MRVVERAERRVGPKAARAGYERADWAAREGKEWAGECWAVAEESWAAGKLGCGFGLRFWCFPFLFLVFSLLFLFQTSHNLFEFKFEFEFNSSTQTNKTMLQHECSNILTL